jgi:HEAT repeat protein
MGREKFIKDLVELLVRIDKGMLEFDEPLPSAVEAAITQAVIAFGEEALPELHTHLADSSPDIDFVQLVDVIGDIGSPTSIPYLINKHQNASFMSGAAAIQALRKIGTDESYLYFGDLLAKRASGDVYVINSGVEIQIACQALGEWGDERAIPFLERATAIYDPNSMPETAIRALAKYPKAHPFLRELAKRKISLKKLIDEIFQEMSKA